MLPLGSDIMAEESMEKDATDPVRLTRPGDCFSWFGSDRYSFGWLFAVRGSVVACQKATSWLCFLSLLQGDGGDGQPNVTRIQTKHLILSTDSKHQGIIFP